MTSKKSFLTKLLGLVASMVMLLQLFGGYSVLAVASSTINSTFDDGYTIGDVPGEGTHASDGWTIVKSSGCDAGRDTITVQDDPDIPMNQALRLSKSNIITPSASTYTLKFADVSGIDCSKKVELSYSIKATAGKDRIQFNQELLDTAGTKNPSTIFTYPEATKNPIYVKDPTSQWGMVTGADLSVVNPMNPVNKWYNIKVVYDYRTSRFDLYLDGRLRWFGMPFSQKAKSIKSFGIKITANSNQGSNDSEIWLDNISLKSVDEPIDTYDLSYQLGMTDTYWQASYGASTTLADTVKIVNGQIQVVKRVNNGADTDKIVLQRNTPVKSYDKKMVFKEKIARGDNNGSWGYANQFPSISGEKVGGREYSLMDAYNGFYGFPVSVNTLPTATQLFTMPVPSGGIPVFNEIQYEADFTGDATSNNVKIFANGVEKGVKSWSGFDLRNFDTYYYSFAIAPGAGAAASTNTYLIDGVASYDLVDLTQTSNTVTASVDVTNKSANAQNANLCVAYYDDSNSLKGVVATAQSIASSDNNRGNKVTMTATLTLPSGYSGGTARAFLWDDTTASMKPLKYKVTSIAVTP
jgi:hypothetical protein